jgi:hypothetical protein
MQRTVWMVWFKTCDHNGSVQIVIGGIYTSEQQALERTHALSSDDVWDVNIQPFPVDALMHKNVSE